MPREPIRHLVAHFSVSRCRKTEYEGLVAVSAGYPSVTGRLLTRYAPFRRSPSKSIATLHAAPRLACVKPAASVHPEPGSNSSLYISLCSFKFPIGINALLLFGTCCLYLVFHYFKEHRYFSNGLQRYGLFSYLQIFSEIFSIFFNKSILFYTFAPC